MAWPSKDPRSYYDPERDKRFNFDWLADGYAEMTAVDWTLRGVWTVFFLLGASGGYWWAWAGSLVLLLIAGAKDLRDVRRKRAAGT